MDRCSDTITSNCYATTCPDSSVQGGCCIFRPRVHVLDNWGWCNGDCPGVPGGAGGGCYDGSWDERRDNECNTDYPDEFHTTKNPWTPTNVKVIVVPR